MKWLERHLGRYAISNLSLYIAIMQAAGFAMELVNSSIINYISLSPYHILRGQIWRLVTWLLVPPQSSSILFVPIAILFYYSIGISLERAWGTVRYNIYILGGVLFTVLGAFITYGLGRLLYGAVAGSIVAGTIPAFFTTYYVLMSIFLAYAATFPDAIVLFMFILPIKVKWLGILYAVGMFYTVYQTWTALSQLEMGFVVWVQCAAIAASLLNFVIFFLMTRDWRTISPAERRRRSAWHRQYEAGARNRGRQGYDPQSARAGADKVRDDKGAIHMRAGKTIHKCAICGRTEASNPDLEFRYCSKCESGYEYCQDHLFTHIHARNGSAPTLMEGQDILLSPDNSAK